MFTRSAAAIGRSPTISCSSGLNRSFRDVALTRSSSALAQRARSLWSSTCAVWRRVVARLREQDVEATAVCLIHSWANPDHEIAVGETLDRLAPGLFHSLSHQILREYREYERTSTAVLNSYVGPRVSRYLKDFEALLAEGGFDGQFLIMQSNGGAMSPETARRLPVATMESGPVGGIIAASEVGRELGVSNLIAFDMGGHDR